MILSFEFNYISQNGLLENLLEAICKEFDISYKIGKSKNIITLKVEADEEALTNFSNFISERLPLSIFFKSTAVNVVDDMSVDEFSIEPFALNLPFTPKVLAQSNPFMNNEVGIETFHAKGILLNGTSFKKDYDELFNQATQIIKNGNSLHVNSASGSYKLAKIDETFKEEDEFLVIPTDLSVIERMVVIKENEIKAIASLEKPSLHLRVNSLYRAKEILPTNKVKMKLADELILLKICEKLYAEGIEFLYRVNCKSDGFENKLEIDGEFVSIPQIEVCVLENGEILIVSGDGYSAPLLKDNLKKFEKPAHAQFASIMQEHNLFDDKVSCFYLSKSHNDKIMHISENTGLLELIKFPIIRNFEDILEEIKCSHQGAKLIDSYKNSFPEIYENALHVKIPNNTPDNMYSIWGIASVLLGFADNIKDGANRLINNAEEYVGQKGPRIDYLLLDKDSIKSDFNMLKLIRSAMSFKLAGTDDITLSFGIMESLAYFVSDTSDSCRENLSSQKTLLAGSIFSSKRFTELVCKNIVVNTQVCFNKELPIDN
jgi:hypothetical protein